LSINAKHKQIEYRLDCFEISDIKKLFGYLDKNLRLIEEIFQVNIDLTPESLIVGEKNDDASLTQVKTFLDELAAFLKEGHDLTGDDIQKMAATIKEGREIWWKKNYSQGIITTAYHKIIHPRTAGQVNYVRAVKENELIFCIGPAGTGKTYLAMAMACAALQKKEVSRIVLVRPAVEAGESLGYLPGDLREKIEPYLRPLYDALYEMLSPERFQKYIEKDIIEVAPLAYMRGRTLNDSFIVLDEAQNTTPEQMKMFLTRMGFGSKVVVTGDITQVDLPSGKNSGLMVIQKILADVSGVEFIYLTEKDVVRHQLVQKIIQAYEKFEKNLPTQEKST